MARIACETEHAMRDKGFPMTWTDEHPSIADITVDAAYHAARAAKVVAIAVGTSTGASARLIARYRPLVPIYAFTTDEHVARQLSLMYAVEPILAAAFESTDQMLHEMERILTESGRVQPGDNIVFVAGQPVGLRGSTNMMKVHRIAGIPR